MTAPMITRRRSSGTTKRVAISAVILAAKTTSAAVVALARSSSRKTLPGTPAVPKRMMTRRTNLSTTMAMMLVEKNRWPLPKAGAGEAGRVPNAELGRRPSNWEWPSPTTTLLPAMRATTSSVEKGTVPKIALPSLPGRKGRKPPSTKLPRLAIDRSHSWVGMRRRRRSGRSLHRQLPHQKPSMPMPKPITMTLCHFILRVNPKSMS
mmetsp:Transcript_426/g.1257  ORF Transcript_426/g.1257 Transcript_426/m.1257 type:complete len:207 (-) Transcript_426:1981-2601(-)